MTSENLKISKNITIPIFFIASLILSTSILCQEKATYPNKNYKKMDTYTGSILKKCSRNDRVNLFVLLNSAVTAEHVKVLESIGCTVSSQAGDVITVNIQVGKIKQLSEFYFVKFIEFSRPMKIEKGEE